MHDLDSKVKLGRVLWDKGYFVRIEVPIVSASTISLGPKRLDTIDVDVLGIRFDDEFASQVAVGQIKPNSARPLHDLLQLKGIMELLKADRGYFVVNSGAKSFRKLANTLGVHALDAGDLDRLESKPSIPRGMFGSLDSHHVMKMQEIRSGLKVLRPQVNYIAYRYWLEPHDLQVKRLVSVARELSKGLPVDSPAYRWLFAESMIRFVVSFCQICNRLYLVRDQDFPTEVSTQLAGGSIQKQAREEIRSAVAEIFSNVLLPDTLKLDRYLKLDPEYAPALSELGWRLVNQSKITSQLPRFADLLWYEFILKRRPISYDSVSGFFNENEFLVLSKLMRNTAEFWSSATDTDQSVLKEIIA